MSQENVEIVRRGYEPGTAGDVEALLATLDPEVEFVNSARRHRTGHVRRHERGSRGRVRATARSWRCTDRDRSNLDAGERRPCGHFPSDAGGRGPGSKIELLSSWQRSATGRSCGEVRLRQPRPKPSKPPGCRSRRCRRRTWRSSRVRSRTRTTEPYEAGFLEAIGAPELRDGEGLPEGPHRGTGRLEGSEGVDGRGPVRRGSIESASTRRRSLKLRDERGIVAHSAPRSGAGDRVWSRSTTIGEARRRSQDGK